MLFLVWIFTTTAFSSSFCGLCQHPSHLIWVFSLFQLKLPQTFTLFSHLVGSLNLKGNLSHYTVLTVLLKATSASWVSSYVTLSCSLPEDSIIRSLSLRTQSHRTSSCPTFAASGKPQVVVPVLPTVYVSRSSVTPILRFS